jgi:hypothetical protein
MGKSDETFRQDRDWHSTDTLPSVEDVVTERDQYAYQKILQRLWARAANEPPDFIGTIPLPSVNSPWWQSPEGLSPRYLEMQRQKALRKLANERG